jgi:hypothetical protein
MGGTDDPSNIIELTIEEHAEAHRKLYEEHGHWQDLVAWKGLLGLLGSGECALAAMREGGKKGARATNLKRWGISVHDDGLSPHKRESGYPMDVDGRKVRAKRYWFNDGKTEGQFSLDDHPEGWMRGRLKSVMKKANPYVRI